MQSLLTLLKAASYEVDLIGIGRAGLMYAYSETKNQRNHLTIFRGSVGVEIPLPLVLRNKQLKKE
jgi:hypothetical protein